MARKKIVIETTTPTIEEAFDNFILAKKAKGLTDKTISTYFYHFKGISKFIDTGKHIDELTKRDTDSMIALMRNSKLSTNSINSYTRTLKSFFSWCNEEELTKLNISLYKTQEVIKDTYTDEELRALLKKPNLRGCRFDDYRSWVIINLLINSGCRASTIRNILIKDVDIDKGVIMYRHTKNKSVQVVPLCTDMVTILRQYLKTRKGGNNDYLFPSQTGEQLSENALRQSIVKYNKSRGVNKTSIHLFRHTFARKYLVDCGGNAFTLQKLLGHSTLDMTKHYCKIYNTDVVNGFDLVCPLTQLNNKKK